MIIVVPKSAQHLHWLLLEAVFNAPLWFFTTVDTSTILNRYVAHRAGDMEYGP
jgi:hypothetical protein